MPVAKGSGILLHEEYDRENIAWKMPQEVNERVSRF